MKPGEQKILRLIKEKVREKEPTAQVILFGSRARGMAHDESDWDILILLDVPRVTMGIKTELRHYMYDLELEIKEPLSVFVYAKNEWETKYVPTPFYKNIQREGIAL